MTPFLLSLLLSCADPDAQPTGSTTTGTGDSTVEPPMEPLFSFVVIADPHVTAGSTENQERLAAAIEWVNQHRLDRGIELVWIVGDVGWNGGLEVVDAMMADCEVTWVPVMGDNEVHIGAEQTFDEVFAPRYAVLEGQMEGWRRGAVQVYDPTYGRELWLQNFAFDHLGIRWVGLDWISRAEGAMGEFAELNDLPDGSLPFLEDETGALAEGPAENVLLFSHHAMHFGVFDLAEVDTLTGLIGPVGDRVAANYAGHYHIDYYELIEDGGYEVFVTDATWDDLDTIRVVDVSGNGVRFAYEQELVVVGAWQ